jgi:hypothetical protein
VKAWTLRTQGDVEDDSESSSHDEIEEQDCEEEEEEISGTFTKNGIVCGFKNKSEGNTQNTLRTVWQL